MKLSIIIPVYNEAQTIVEVVERVRAVDLPGVDKEIIIANDGSSDGSSELLDRLQQTYPAVRVLHFDRNYGQSSAFAAGFKHSTGDLVITLDGVPYVALERSFHDTTPDLVSFGRNHVSDYAGREFNGRILGIRRQPLATAIQSFSGGGPVRLGLVLSTGAAGGR